MDLDQGQKLKTVEKYWQEEEPEEERNFQFLVSFKLNNDCQKIIQQYLSNIKGRSRPFFYVYNLL